MSGVGSFAVPPAEEMARARANSAASNKRKAELAKNPPDLAFDWRKLFADES